MHDNQSAYYNRYRNKSQGGFRWRLPSSHPNSSERLTDFPTQYEFAFVTSFNASQVRHRGGGDLPARQRQRRHRRLRLGAPRRSCAG